MTKKLNVLSVFDGISCARLALERADIDVAFYYASEIDEYAIDISKKNWPSIVRLNGVEKITKNVQHLLPSFDLLIGGSPCQDLSIAKRGREGLSGARSGLFWEYARLVKELRPKYFILENVASMSTEAKNLITAELGVQPIMINAKLVSAQERKRLFWTNIPNVTLPSDRNIKLKDVVDLNLPRKWVTHNGMINTSRGVKWDKSGKGYFSVQDRAYSLNDVMPALSASRTITKVNIYHKGKVATLTWPEIEALQGLPTGYTDLGKNTIEKRGRAIGNAFNVDVVAHILSFIK